MSNTHNTNILWLVPSNVRALKYTSDDFLCSHFKKTSFLELGGRAFQQLYRLLRFHQDVLDLVLHYPVALLLLPPALGV